MSRLKGFAAARNSVVVRFFAPNRFSLVSNEADTLTPLYFKLYVTMGELASPKLFPAVCPQHFESLQMLQIVLLSGMIITTHPPFKPDPLVFHNLI